MVSVETLFYICVNIVLSLLIFTTLKFMDLGISVKDAISLSLLFPIKIFRLHIYLCREIRKEGKFSFLKFLFLPIINLPTVLIGYAYAFIQVRAEVDAIKELILTLSKDELEKLKFILKEEKMDINVVDSKVTNLSIELSQVFKSKYLEFNILEQYQKGSLL